MWLGLWFVDQQKQQKEIRAWVFSAHLVLEVVRLVDQQLDLLASLQHLLNVLHHHIFDVVHLKWGLGLGFGV